MNGIKKQNHVMEIFFLGKKINKGKKQVIIHEGKRKARKRKPNEVLGGRIIVVFEGWRGLYEDTGDREKLNLKERERKYEIVGST